MGTEPITVFSPFLQYGSFGILSVVLIFGGYWGSKIAQKFLEQLLEQNKHQIQVTESAVKHISESVIIQQQLLVVISEQDNRNSHAHQKILESIEDLNASINGK